MRHDGFLTVTRQPGCTEADVHDILRFLTESNGPFDYVTILPEAEDVSGPGATDEPNAAPAARYPTAADLVHAAVHGAGKRMGEVKVIAKNEVNLYEEATLSVTAHPYRQAASIDVATAGAHVSWHADAATLHELRDMLEEAEQVLLRTTREAVSVGRAAAV